MRPENASQFPRNPKQAHQWMSNVEDYQKLDAARKRQPIFATKTSYEEQRRLDRLSKLPQHNPEYLESRQRSIE